MRGADYEHFDARMRRIERRNRALARGYVMEIDSDGLIVARPRRRAGSWSVFFLKIAIIVMAFKVVAYSVLGADDYTNRVAILAEGNELERIGAWVMAADPVTVWLSVEIAKLLT